MLFKDAKKNLKSHQKELTQRGARTLSIFGSTARGTAKARSDVDILVDFDPRKGLFAFAGLKIFLEEILKCRVDLVNKRALHPALKERILREARQIFSTKKPGLAKSKPPSSQLLKKKLEKRH
jgi:predicted nucleotidyltransferase